MKLQYQELDHDITCLETYYQRPHLACCYLIESNGEAAFIDTGTANSMPLAEELLGLKGIAPEQVKYVMPTHVHLDHAGATGQMMAAFPNATLIIHPFGARHMIDPTKLIAGVKAVYGEEVYQRDYGAILPVDAARVVETVDGHEALLGKRRLVFLDTPGHARHHYCIWDEQSRGFFTGDTFGIAYPEFKTEKGAFPFLPTTPVQFDPTAWHATIDRLLSYQPERMYLTHFCQIEEVERIATELHQQIDDYAGIARVANPENRYQEIYESLNSYLRGRLKAHGCTLPENELVKLLELDLGLCAQGLDIWMQRESVA